MFHSVDFGSHVTQPALRWAECARQHLPRFSLRKRPESLPGSRVRGARCPSLPQGPVAGEAVTGRLVTGGPVAAPRRLRPGIIALMSAFASLILCYPASATSDPCDGVDTALTDARKHQYATRIANSLTIKVKPSTVIFDSFMTSGAWSAVYAATPETEWGFFFFETVSGQKQFKDVWGGFAVEEDRPELIAWAKALGAPESLAKCFAHAVTS